MIDRDAKPAIAILSIGDMGLGIAKLLVSQGYRVATFAEDRRSVTAYRIHWIGIFVLGLFFIPNSPVHNAPDQRYRYCAELTSQRLVTVPRTELDRTG